MSEASERGLLFVLSEPGATATLEEFNGSSDLGSSLYDKIRSR